MRTAACDIPFSRPEFDEAEARAVADVLAMNRLAEGWPAGFSLGAARRGSAAGAAARGVRGILEYFRTDVLTDLAEDDIHRDRLCVADAKNLMVL